MLQFILNYVFLNNLFSALAQGPYKTLFIALVLVRFTAWLGLPVVCLWWFNNAINELKREAAVVESLAVGRAAVDQPQ